MLLDELTQKQMMEWEAFDRVQPIGGKRWDFYFAQLLMNINNLAISIHGKKGSKQFKLEDFIPNWTGETEKPKEMSGTDIKQWFKAFAKGHNKKVREKKRQQEKPKK